MVLIEFAGNPDGRQVALEAAHATDCRVGHVSSVRQVAGDQAGPALAVEEACRAMPLDRLDAGRRRGRGEPVGARSQSSLVADWRRNKDWLTRLVVTVYRYGAWCLRQPRPVGVVLRVPHRLVNSLLLRAVIGIDLPAQASIGPGLRLHHLGRGVTIHKQAVLGADVEIFQSVAIGQRDDSGVPVIGDRVTIGAGACILGPVSLGDDCRVGANAVVLDDVPSGGRALAPKATIMGPPADPR